MATHLLRTSLHSTQSVSQPISYLNIFGLAFGILHSVVQAHPFFGVSIIITVLVAHSNICPPVVISLPQRGDNNDHLKFQAVALQVVTKKGLVTTENQTRLIPASEKGKSIKDERYQLHLFRRRQRNIQLGLLPEQGQFVNVHGAELFIPSRSRRNPSWILPVVVHQNRVMRL